VNLKLLKQILFDRIQSDSSFGSLGVLQIYSFFSQIAQMPFFPFAFACEV